MSLDALISLLARLVADEVIAELKESETPPPEDDPADPGNPDPG